MFGLVCVGDGIHKTTNDWMDKMKLTPAQQAELKFLRSQVDQRQDAAYSKGAEAKIAMWDNRDRSISHALWQARKDLTDYVSSLRQAGHNI